MSFLHILLIWLGLRNDYNSLVVHVADVPYDQFIKKNRGLVQHFIWLKATIVITDEADKLNGNIKHCKIYNKTKKNKV